MAGELATVQFTASRLWPDEPRLIALKADGRRPLFDYYCSRRGNEVDLAVGPRLFFFSFFTSIPVLVIVARLLSTSQVFLPLSTLLIPFSCSLICGFYKFWFLSLRPCGTHILTKHHNHYYSIHSLSTTKSICSYYRHPSLVDGSKQQSPSKSIIPLFRRSTLFLLVLDSPLQNPSSP